jgi:NADH-quinone oxidoreductase subunit L
MLMNRVADGFFILAILLILQVFKTADYLIVLNLVCFIKNDNVIFFGYSLNLVFLISLFLFIGAVGKSAQIGLHT